MANVNATASIYEQLTPPGRQDEGTGDLGQSDFLKLMTTQLRNQDPFSPMENGEFLGQIAQFGTVTGIQELQESFGSLSSALQSNRALQASVLVGKQVLVAGDRAELGAEGLRGAVDLPGAVSDLRVWIEGGNGETLGEVALGSQAGGVVDFTWDGRLADGASAPPGIYTVRAEGRVGTEAQALGVMARANVDSVTLGSGVNGLSLDLGALGEVPLDAVRRIA